MSEKLEIFKKPEFDESIIKEEFHTYYPHTKSFDNSDEIEISINQQDAFLSMSESAIFISGKYTEQKGSGKDQNEIGTCTLSNNCGLHLFESISYELNGKELDRIKDPGIICTIKGLACYNSDELRALNIAGFITDTDTLETINTNDNSFTFRIPLKYIFGLFNDYRQVIKGKQTFRLVRSRNDYNCYTSTGTKRLIFTLDNIELKIKHVYPNDLLKLKLLKDINTDKTIVIPFRKWDYHELPSLRKTDSDIWAVKTSTKIEKPRFVIVTFQTDKKDNPKANVSVFDHIKLTNLKVYLNNQSYPYENMNLDFDKWHYTEAYQSYVDFQKQYSGKPFSEPAMSYALFKSKPIFIIDCQKQEEAIQSSTVDVKLEFRSKENFPESTKAYCIIIHDSIFQYKPLSGLVTSLI